MWGGAIGIQVVHVGDDVAGSVGGATERRKGA